MINSWGGPFDQVSKKLGKNCGFYNNSIFLGHISILGPHTVSWLDFEDFCPLPLRRQVYYIILWSTIDCHRHFANSPPPLACLRNLWAVPYYVFSLKLKTLLASEVEIQTSPSNKFTVPLETKRNQHEFLQKSLVEYTLEALVWIKWWTRQGLLR